MAIGVTGGGRTFDVDIVVTGVDKTSQDFRDVRRDLNGTIRTAMVAVGEAEVLPDMRSRFPGRRWAASLYVKKDRSGVFVGSRMRGQMNRAMGWLDFGGQRPRDNSRREGPYVMVTTLRSKRDRIDDAIERRLLEDFRAHGFDVTF